MSENMIFGRSRFQCPITYYVYFIVCVNFHIYNLNVKAYKYFKRIKYPVIIFHLTDYTIHVLFYCLN